VTRPRLRIKHAALAAAPLIALLFSAGASAAFPQDPPNDPVYDASPLPNWANEQWDLASPAGGFDRGISADRAWRLSTGRGAVVADIDVGVDLDQEDLASQWFRNPGETGTDARGRDRRTNRVDDDGNGYVDDWRGWDFYNYDNDPTSDTENSHGTHVAGVLAAKADNGIGIAGVAPDARVMPLRTSDNILHQGVRVGEAIVYATDNGANAISMSLGTDSFSRTLRRAATYAYRHNVVMAVASGNEFHFHHHYPQVHDDVLAVGGINPDTADLRSKNPSLAPTGNDFKVRASYSDYGPHLDVVAPTQVPTAEWGGGTILTWDGTSAATPHVAGVATLLAARGKQLGLHLTAGEIVEIIRMTADDLTDPSEGFAPGWDRRSGWGRVNAYRAVKRVRRGEIPPVPNITAPGWYRPEKGRVRIRATLHARAATHWQLYLGRGEQPTEWNRIGHGFASRDAARGRGVRVGTVLRGTELDAGGYTLRIRATDADGNLGEDRDFFYMLGRQHLRPGYPRFLGTSGESSPQLADLNRDGAKDIVLATSDGLLRAYSGRTGRMLSGWPRRMKTARHSRPISRRIGPVRPGFLATPAVGDVAGGGAPEVVAAGLDGRVYAWTRSGERVRGFPFRIGLHKPAADGRRDAAIYASPALANLAGDRKLETVFGAADQHIYALKGNGRPVKGWPVLAQDGDYTSKILSSPAIGDLDGDGKPDVVEGTAEAYGSTPNTTGRLYAFDAHGHALAGWPVAPPALAADSIPLAGQGVPDSPSLADVDGDGDDEVAIAAFTGEPELYDGDGTRMSGAGGQSHFEFQGRGASSPASASAILALGANSAFGRTTPGGPLRYFGGAVDAGLGLAQLSPATHVSFEHLLGGWDAASGSWLPAFPIPVEGWEIVTSPAVADVDGDGRAEVLNGTSGDVLHAFADDGSEPRGWPKQTGGWLMAAPSVGDVDGDGKLEVVAVTRDGYLFVWNTRSRHGRVEWGSFRHDRRNTGRYPG
jgi:subtilisin family serine protease